MILFSFHPACNLEKWQIINDSVMGGRSESQIHLDQDGHGVYHGKVSLENNGGFSSLHYNVGSVKLDDFEKIRINIKGDGKEFQLRIKSRDDQRESYGQSFKTTGDWQVLEFELKNFKAIFRGRRLSLPNFHQVTLCKLFFLIANRNPEEFELVLDQIELI
ncbi:MAG: CIA30 family protein [Saprospiraceae bacterium]|nr:CIA30 family protein [Saprospiraceae bacterium]